ncbi:3-oxoacyl-ACP reductase [Carbonactinospora thermoautotrophica]|uniref:3-oxoacyl-ACP reductase n=1 Tax=Carbonactinospora thermoautotrophica TaxID=1469144 RepID=UPI00226EBF8C|nr:3-oxoacyl-ACP reductase [Carbonactinospora thermoautotrophica]MCX9192837.1 3-oxoacyl-ACP reductase [Carbonactinospora thermoautotrophica]
MRDRYQAFVTSGPGRFIAKRLGLPIPVRLERHRPGQPVVPGPVLLGGTGRLLDPAGKVLHAVDAEIRTAAGGDDRFAALVFDASGIRGSAELRALYDFFHPVVRRLRECGRLIVLGAPPEDCADPGQATAQRALEGFVRSVGKEIRGGRTAQLLYVAEGAENGIESTLRFFLSAKSAYVSAQVVRIGVAGVVAPDDWDRPLAGRVALVTGAARGIGAAIAEVLARDGAHVVCLDTPAQDEALAGVAARVGGSVLGLDITAPAAPRALAEHLTSEHGGVDVVVHNAGVTRDKTLARMSGQQWDTVLDVNLSSQERINDVLLGEGVLRANGRVVCVSSVSGIAGNVGQTNYATSKAGVIGMVQALAPRLRERQATINAVAPGFIETRMTAAIPPLIREAGRRMNSMAQGGLPVDVAETVAWLAHPASGGVNGNVVRVCGQSLLGA